jgi:hypothetical protein
MKKTHKRCIICVLIALLTYSIYCSDDRHQVEDNTPPFNPLYFRDTMNMHMAFFFDVRNGNLSQSLKPRQVRPGGMPYHSRTRGEFVVVYKDSNNTELGRYAIQNPTYVRSYDVFYDTTGDMRPIISGTIEILTPYDNRIYILQIVQPGATTTFINVQIPFHHHMTTTPQQAIIP